MVRFEWLGERDSLDEIADAWDELAERDATPFASYAWFASWVDAFAPASGLRVLVAWEDDRLAAVLPLLARNDGLAAAANYHTPVFRAAATGPELVHAAYRHALAATAGTFEVGALRQGDAGLAALLGAPGRRAVTEDGAVAPAVDLSGGLEAWRESLSRNRVKDLRRRARRLREVADVHLRVLQPPSELASEFEAGMRVEAAGWKGRAGTAILSRPDTVAFYRNLATRLHAAGKLRFCGLEIDGELAAFEYMVVHGESVWSLKGGYDERFARFAPGLQIQVAAIECAFQLGLRTYELLGADESWKRSLANDERHTVRVRSFPSSLPGMAHQLAWQHLAPRARRVRALLRSGPRR